MEENVETDIEFNVNVQTYDPEREKMVDVVVWSKLTKFTGDPSGQKSEGWLNFIIEPGEVINGMIMPRVTANYHSKNSKTEESAGL